MGDVKTAKRLSGGFSNHMIALWKIRIVGLENYVKGKTNGGE